MRSIYYYSTTTITAVILGIILVLTIRPGDFKNSRCNRSQGALANISLGNYTIDGINNIYNGTIDESLINECKFFEKKELKVGNTITTVDTMLDLVR